MGSLVDAAYELLDPTPDVHALFCEYDVRFFDGRLAACEVKWSPRMTTCAGICCYEVHSGLCSIKLSTPLLKLRPRSDLVETLLHEMIHAFLFVTVRDRDRDGHGPQFQWHMHRINKEAGTRISIYHSFHAEVAVYKNHHWRCDGPCRDRRPFFGWVKRASNRAPSKNDLWWAEHERSCGGKFAKVSEPAEYTEKKEKAEQKKIEGGGGEKKRGGAKPVVDDAKQPRIDSVFGGGGAGARLGGADSKAAVKAETGGGAGGGGTKLGKFAKVSEPAEYTEKKEKAEKKKIEKIEKVEGGGGGEKKRGGVKPVVDDAKQPRIDSVFGGGGPGARLGGADGNKTGAKTETDGGGGANLGGADGSKAAVKPEMSGGGGGTKLGGADDKAAVKTETGGGGGGGQMLGGGAGRSRLLDLYGSGAAPRNTVVKPNRSDDDKITVDKPNRSDNNKNTVIEVIELD